jgi:magnesium-transporting ATPase (P-type)
MKTASGNLPATPPKEHLLTMSYKAGLKDFKPERIDTIPFESDHKYMASLNKVDDEMVVFLSGAPERILELCDKQLTADGNVDVDKRILGEKMEEVAAKASGSWGWPLTPQIKTVLKLKRTTLKSRKYFWASLVLLTRHAMK